MPDFLKTVAYAHSCLAIPETTNTKACFIQNIPCIAFEMFTGFLNPPSKACKSYISQHLPDVPRVKSKYINSNLDIFAHFLKLDVLATRTSPLS